MKRYFSEGSESFSYRSTPHPEEQSDEGSDETSEQKNAPRDHFSYPFAIVIFTILLGFINFSLNHVANSFGQPENSLDWIHTDGGKFLDSSGRVVILRGFVTITSNGDRSDLNYTLADYQRMRSWGANLQSIRVYAGALGAWPGKNTDPSYLEKLDRMVLLAKQVGMYTEFKLTAYDIKGFKRMGYWEALWQNDNGVQEKVIDGWKQLWRRYKDEPAVVGYDLFNEPEKGNLQASNEELIAKYLTPFYQKAIDELRKIDQRHLAFFQPMFGAQPYKTSIGRSQLVYAPHYYPNWVKYIRQSDFSTADYAPTIKRFADEARLQNAVLFIGEYDMPWSPKRDGDLSYESSYQKLEETANKLFDQYQLSYSRPWFADDRAGITLSSTFLRNSLGGGGDRMRQRRRFGLRPYLSKQSSEIPQEIEFNHAVIRGKSGLNGPERKFIIDIFSRPYPQKVAGILESFQYDFNSKRFIIRYMPEQSKGVTEIYIPQKRHFKNGFIIKHNKGISFVYNLSQPGELKLTDNSANIDSNSFFWSQDTNLLMINEWLNKEEDVTLEILPL